MHFVHRKFYLILQKGIRLTLSFILFNPFLLLASEETKIIPVSHVSQLCSLVLQNMIQVNHDPSKRLSGSSLINYKDVHSQYARFSQFLKKKEKGYTGEAVPDSKNPISFSTVMSNERMRINRDNQMELPIAGRDGRPSSQSMESVWLPNSSVQNVSARVRGF